MNLGETKARIVTMFWRWKIFDVDHLRALCRAVKEGQSDNRGYEILP